MKKPKIVFDVDDTISVHEDRDYVNAKPKIDVIEKLNYLHDVLGYEVVLYTARGMISCEGDLCKIIEKNKVVLETWLEKHGVKYDELIFGKPLADMYIDDKCMNVDQFLEQGFCKLKGGSNKEVIRIGNIVRKHAGIEKIKKTIAWNKRTENIVRTPKIISSTYDYLYMEYIDNEYTPELMGDEQKAELFAMAILAKMYIFKSMKEEKFNIKYHKNKVKLHMEERDKRILPYAKKCLQLLDYSKDTLNEHASFCHGDLTFSNIIYNKEALFWIDPEYVEGASSYLLDLAKLRMSFMGYEYTFGFSNVKPEKMKEILRRYDNWLIETNIYEIVLILNYMWIIRLWKYKSDGEEKDKVLGMLNVMEEQHEDIFGIG